MNNREHECRGFVERAGRRIYCDEFANTINRERWVSPPMTLTEALQKMKRRDA